MVTVSEVSTRYVDEFAALDPVSAARMMGLALNAATMTDYSPDGVAAYTDFLRRTSRELAAASVTGEEERLGRLYLSERLSTELALVEDGERERWVSILHAPPSMVRMLFDLSSPAAPQEWAALADRLDRVPGAIAGYRRTLAEGLAGGRVASRRSAEAAAGQCAVWAGNGRGWFSAFADRQAASGPPELAERLRGAGAAADAAYGELAGWFRSEYLPHADPADGVGGDRYVLQARSSLGTSLDLDEAYEWGWQELARLEAEQAAESDRVSPGMGFAGARDLLNEDPARCIEGAEAWQRWLQEVTDRAVEFLDGRHFDIPEPLRRCVVAIPPEGSAAAPYYTPPSEDLNQPGKIWFPLVGRSRFPTWDGVTTVFHEAVPGHHLQFGAVRTASLTRSHRLGFHSAHGEGWALYAERLMDELGRFERPEFRLGFLSMQLFRAARVVLDIGVHTGRSIPLGREHGGSRWSFETGVEFLRKASGLTREFCESEVLRYLSWPGQAPSYKLGERVWLRGREEARRRQGPAFDLKGWHAKALALGPLGIDDLAAEFARIAAG
jgi:uncharacterized protein (DUF885 family)